MGLPREKVQMILHCLVEGNSIRGTARLCDVEKRTVLNILKLAGENCERLLEERVRNVRVADLELDGVWTYVGCKQKPLTPERVEKGMAGKALRGFEASVWQVRADDPGGTYRAVYVVQLQDAVYVLHVFRKKAKSGIATPRRDIEVIRQRLKLARNLAGK